MKNVSLIKSRMGAGWFLTIRDKETGVENRWAVTSKELLKVKDVIEDKMRDIMQEVHPTVSEKEWADIVAYKTPIKEKDLRFSATSRCDCGAGLAYYKKCDPFSVAQGAYWDCADILLNRQPDYTGKHTGQLPFTFYEIKSEDQPSANGATTRECINHKHIVSQNGGKAT